MSSSTAPNYTGFEIPIIKPHHAFIEIYLPNSTFLAQGDNINVDQINKLPINPNSKIQLTNFISYVQQTIAFDEAQLVSISKQSQDIQQKVFFTKNKQALGIISTLNLDKDNYLLPGVNPGYNANIYVDFQKVQTDLDNLIYTSNQGGTLLIEDGESINYQTALIELKNSPTYARVLENYTKKLTELAAKKTNITLDINNKQQLLSAAQARLALM